jgi:hypothetical protein
MSKCKLLVTKYGIILALLLYLFPKAGLSQSNDTTYKLIINYVDKNTIDKNKLNKCKVITVTASTANNDCFGNMFIGYKNDIHSESYISFNTDSEEEAKSLLSFLKTRFANFLLKLRKVTHNISENTCKWIPLPPLNTIWTDEKVYKYYKLSNDEIKLVTETKITGYKDIIDSVKKKESNDNITDTDSSKDEKVKTKPKKSTKSKTMVV